jgi:hypothetical protein
MAGWLILDTTSGAALPNWSRFDQSNGASQRDFAAQFAFLRAFIA